MDKIKAAVLIELDEHQKEELEAAGKDMVEFVYVPEDMSREEGENCGIRLAREFMAMTDDFADGYYFSFPFNRVHMLKKILG